ncbi:MAG: RDD family protein, partial [Pseudomonadales bacterium]|nr:RDD family protein [Pseudomonadales bacterium]
MTASEPTQPDHESSEGLPAAGLWRRLAAMLYDGFLVVAIWMVLGYFIQFVFGTETNQVVNGRVETDPIQDTVLFL